MFYQIFTNYKIYYSFPALLHYYYLDTVDLFPMLTRLLVALVVLEEPPALMSNSQRPACQVIIFHSLSSSLDLCFLSKI